MDVSDDYKEDQEEEKKTLDNIKEVKFPDDESEEIFHQIEKSINQNWSFVFNENSEKFLSLLENQSFLDEISTNTIAPLFISTILDSSLPEFHLNCIKILRKFLYSSNATKIVTDYLNESFCEYLISLFERNDPDLTANSLRLLSQICLIITQLDYEIPVDLIPDMFLSVIGNENIHEDIHIGVIQFVTCTYPRESSGNLIEFAISIWKPIFSLKYINALIKIHGNYLDEMFNYINYENIFFTVMMPLLYVQESNEMGLSLRDNQCIYMFQTIQTMFEYMDQKEKEQIIKEIDLNLLVNNLHYLNSPNILIETLNLLYEIAPICDIISAIVEANIDFHPLLEGRISLKYTTMGFLALIIKRDLPFDYIKSFLSEDFVEEIISSIDISYADNQETEDYLINPLDLLNSIICISSRHQLYEAFDLFESTYFDEILEEIETEITNVYILGLVQQIRVALSSYSASQHYYKQSLVVQSIIDGSKD